MAPNASVYLTLVIKVSSKIRSILDQKDADSEERLRPFYQYTSWAINSREGKNFHENGALFKLPQKIDYQNLVYQNIDGKKKKKTHRSTPSPSLKRRLTYSGMPFFIASILYRSKSFFHQDY